jgi:hypothetical protein
MPPVTRLFLLHGILLVFSFKLYFHLISRSTALARVSTTSNHKFSLPSLNTATKINDLKKRERDKTPRRRRKISSTFRFGDKNPRERKKNFKHNVVCI